MYVVIGENALIHERFRVDAPHGGVSVNTLVHPRLGISWLVPLIVPMPAIPHQIDDHVPVKLLAVHHRELDRRQAGFRIVGVDVDDWDIKPLGKVAREIGRARFVGRCRKADLIVGDDMERAAGPIAR